MFARHTGQSRINIDQIVCAAAAAVPIKCNEQIEATFVVDAIAVEPPARVLRYRKILSFALTEIRQIALFPDLLKRLAGNGGRKGLAGVKYPNAVFFGERTSPADRAQSDVFTRCFHLQRVPRFQISLIPQWFVNHYIPVKHSGLNQASVPFY